MMSPILIPENAFTAQEFDQVRVRMWTMVTERLEGQAFARECPAQGRDISYIGIIRGIALQGTAKISLLPLE